MLVEILEKKEVKCNISWEEQKKMIEAVNIATEPRKI